MSSPDFLSDFAHIKNSSGPCANVGRIVGRDEGYFHSGQGLSSLLSGKYHAELGRLAPSRPIYVDGFPGDLGDQQK